MAGDMNAEIVNYYVNLSCVDFSIFVLDRRHGKEETLKVSSEGEVYVVDLSCLCA